MSNQRYGVQDVVIALIASLPENKKTISIDLPEIQNFFYKQKEKGFTVLQNLEFSWEGPLPTCYNIRNCFWALHANNFLSIASVNPPKYEINKPYFAESLEKRKSSFEQGELEEIVVLSQAFTAAF